MHFWARVGVALGALQPLNQDVLRLREVALEVVQHAEVVDREEQPLVVPELHPALARAFEVDGRVGDLAEKRKHDRELVAHVSDVVHVALGLVDIQNTLQLVARLVELAAEAVGAAELEPSLGQS